MLAALLGTTGADCAAAEESIPERIYLRLAGHSIVRADFSQTKKMEALKRPLVTSGRVVVSRADGLIWQIDHPYKVTYVLSRDRLIEVAPDGNWSVRAVRDVPGIEQVGRIFRGLLSADASALTEYFHVVAREASDRWEIDLSPRQPEVARFLRGIRISGGAFVESVRLEEAASESTAIQFFNSRSTGELSPEERRLLSGQ